jgi:hypothetical protein
VGQQLIEELKRVGPDAVVDMDNAMCRESLDVIGVCSLPFMGRSYTPSCGHSSARVWARHPHSHSCEKNPLSPHAH